MQHQKLTWSQCGHKCAQMLFHVALLWLHFSDWHLAGTIKFLPSSPIRTSQKTKKMIHSTWTNVRYVSTVKSLHNNVFDNFYCNGFLLEQNRYKQARQHDVGPLDCSGWAHWILNPPFICWVHSAQDQVSAFKPNSTSTPQL